MDRKSQISYALVKLMDENKTHGKDLAEYLGVTPSTVSNYRNGTRSIDVDTLFRICDYYDISIADMLEIDADEEQQNESKYAYVSFDDGLESKSTQYINEMYLSDDEVELVNIYRSLPPKGQHAVLTGLKDYAERE